MPETDVANSDVWNLFVLTETALKCTFRLSSTCYCTLYPAVSFALIVSVVIPEN